MESRIKDLSGKVPGTVLLYQRILAHRPFADLTYFNGRTQEVLFLKVSAEEDPQHVENAIWAILKFTN